MEWNDGEKEREGTGRGRGGEGRGGKSQPPSKVLAMALLTVLP